MYCRWQYFLLRKLFAQAETKNGVTPNPKEESFGKLHVKEKDIYNLFSEFIWTGFFSDMLNNGTEVLVAFDL